MARTTGSSNLTDRVVFDCMLYLQAAARPHRTHECFNLVRSGAVGLCTSAEIIAEVQDVLGRPRLQKKFPALTPEAVRTFLSEVLAMAVTHRNVATVFTLPRDPKDEKYVNLAIAVSARYLVSRDHDLLDLMTTDSAEARRLRTLAPDLRILEPADFLREVADAAAKRPRDGE